MVTNISLYFLLPGSMSLMALLAGQQHLLWQVSFFVASGIGAVETCALLLRERAQAAGRPPWARVALRWVGVALYLIVAVAALVAFIPSAARRLNVDPLTLSGVLITLLVVAGVVLAWLYFIEPAALTAQAPVRRPGRRS
jgi:Mg/Co/Ni transporter MgtE